MTCKCGCTNVHYIKKGPHIGEYCNECGKWLGWIPKNKTAICDATPKNAICEASDMFNEYNEPKEPSPYDGDYFEYDSPPWEE